MDYEQEEREAIQSKPRPIDAVKLCRVLNDHWLAVSPRDTDTEEVKKERAAMCRGIDDTLHIMEQMPTLDLSFTGYGRWELVPEAKMLLWQCSGCGNNSPVKFNFCPYCGKEMEG